MIIEPNNIIEREKDDAYWLCYFSAAAMGGILSRIPPFADHYGVNQIAQWARACGKALIAEIKRVENEKV